MEIKHVIVLMLENRSFDSMLGMLYPRSEQFDGLTGTEQNVWHRADGSVQAIPVWTSPQMTTAAACSPDPDPGELFADIQVQVHGLTADGQPNPGASAMGGFVDNYMRQPSDPKAEQQRDPAAVMHYFTPNQVPIISQLARAFGVSDRWHASAPCQTWPNRFFAHCATANGYVNNAVPTTHFPYMMQTVFNRLASVRQTWRVYFHDIPQSMTLSRLWDHAFTNFRYFEEAFGRDAANGDLPAYSFIEPRYFTDVVRGLVPNDQHPPHDVVHGEALVAAVYNAVRNGPAWNDSLLIVTYDEHGGCYDHVVPPAARSPDNRRPDGFDFGQFGVRVPAVIVSPFIPPGSIIRPPGATPFDHTTIIATLRKLFKFSPLTERDAAAPDLLHSLSGDGSNNGPPGFDATVRPAAPEQLARAAARPPNGMQHALNAAAMVLPTAGANLGAHIQRLGAVTDPAPSAAASEPAAKAIAAHVRAFLGLP